MQTHGTKSKRRSFE
jgi:hypothetical protein